MKACSEECREKKGEEWIGAVAPELVRQPHFQHFLTNLENTGMFMSLSDSRSKQSFRKRQNHTF